MYDSTQTQELEKLCRSAQGITDPDRQAIALLAVWRHWQAMVQPYAVVERSGGEHEDWPPVEFWQQGIEILRMLALCAMRHKIDQMPLVDAMAVIANFENGIWEVGQGTPQERERAGLAIVGPFFAARLEATIAALEVVLGCNQPQRSDQEINQAGKEFLHNNPDATIRELAAALKISTKRAGKMLCWKAAVAQRRKDCPKPRAESLPPDIAATRELDILIAEQKADRNHRHYKRV